MQQQKRVRLKSIIGFLAILASFLWRIYLFPDCFNFFHTLWILVISTFCSSMKIGLCGWLSQFGALLSPPWPLFIWVLRIFVWGFEYVPNWLYLFDFTCLKLRKSRMGLCGWLSQFGALLSPPWPLFIWVLRIFVWGFEYVPNWLYLFDFTCLKLRKSRMGLCGWLSQFGALQSPLWPLVGPHLLFGGNQYCCHLTQSDHKNVPRHIQECHIISPAWCKDIWRNAESSLTSGRAAPSFWWKPVLMSSQTTLLFSIWS